VQCPGEQDSITISISDVFDDISAPTATSDDALMLLNDPIRQVLSAAAACRV
jgi:hypothetical protein